MPDRGDESDQPGFAEDNQGLRQGHLPAFRWNLAIRDPMTLLPLSSPFRRSLAREGADGSLSGQNDALSASLVTGCLIQNRFRVIRPLGGGGMSRVYLVEQVANGARHALKVQYGDDFGASATREMTRKMALREAAFLTTLAHPNLPRVTECFHDEDRIYLVMDYIEGKNLKSLLEAKGSRPFPVETVLNWGIEICAILSYLHNQRPSIIFRDIKPANLILRPDGGLTLVDFGIARYARKGANTDTVMFGSPGYAPPEQYGHGQTDARSDIYALGATLYHLLSGQLPPIGAFRWPPLHTLNPLVPPSLERLVKKCLSSEPARRPANTMAVSKVLKSLR